MRIYDYVDIQVKMQENMYQKRLNGYASMGYKAKGEEIMDASLDIIFNKDNFLPVFNKDIIGAKKEILIVSPFVRKRRTYQMIQHLKISTGKNIRVIVVTRPKEDFTPKDHAVLKKALVLGLPGFLISAIIFKHLKYSVSIFPTIVLF
ncbi:MAG: hypothetical protein ACMUHX_01500 [bacterium]